MQHHLGWWRRETNIKQHRLTNTSHIPVLLHITGSSHSHCLHCTKELRPSSSTPSLPQVAFSSTGLSTSDSHPPLALSRSFSSAPDFQTVLPDYRGRENMCQAFFLAKGSELSVDLPSLWRLLSVCACFYFFIIIQPHAALHHSLVQNAAAD